jgi:hypothetical protein
VRRQLGRFVANEPTMGIWVRTSTGGRARVELSDEDPVEIGERPIAGGHAGEKISARPLENDKEASELETAPSVAHRRVGKAQTESRPSSAS